MRAPVVNLCVKPTCRPVVLTKRFNTNLCSDAITYLFLSVRQIGDVPWSKCSYQSDRSSIYISLPFCGLSGGWEGPFFSGIPFVHPPKTQGFPTPLGLPNPAVEDGGISKHVPTVQKVWRELRWAVFPIFVVDIFQFTFLMCSDFSAMAAYSRRMYVCVYVYTNVHVYKHVWCLYTCLHTSADPICEVVTTYNRFVRCRLVWHFLPRQPCCRSLDFCYPTLVRINNIFFSSHPHLFTSSISFFSSYIFISSYLHTLYIIFYIFFFWDILIYFSLYASCYTIFWLTYFTTSLFALGPSVV